MNWLSFRFQNLYYCIRATEVQAVVAAPSLSQFARLPVIFAGAIHFRGRLIGVLDFLRIQGKTLSEPVSQCLVLQEPFQHLGLRTPGWLETLESPQEDVVMADQEDPLVEGILSAGSRQYRLVSALRIASCAQRAVQEAKGKKVN